LKSPQDWPAANVEMRPIDKLVPYARNSRTHSPKQIDQLAASMQEWGWTNPVLIDEKGTIIAGHGRILAAQKLGITEAPVMTAKGWSDAQKRAYVIADNKLALNAGWDMATLAIEVADLQGFDLSLTGFSSKALEGLSNGKSLDPTSKIDGLSYAIVIRCEGEIDQMELLEKLEAQGLKCEALIS
jgi:ParB-like chromosome segregation protein Spo0J